VTRILRLAVPALVVACSRGPAPAGTEPPPPPPAPIDAAPITAPPPMADAAPIDWRIEPGRVGPIAVGAALPGVLLARDLAGRYLARYIADAQPVDGFEFSDPPVMVLIAGGPFAAACKAAGAVLAPQPDTRRDAGAEAARSGAVVDRIMVVGAGPATADGLGVGSSFDAIKAAHPDAHLGPRPETLGNDVCVATSKSLPGVAFVFSTCSKARAGEPALRVELWSPGS